MKILLVSDIESKYLWDYFDIEKFKDIELIISCGDLKAEYLSFLVTFIKAPLFYVPGNHDQNYDINPPEGCECIDGKFIIYKGIRIIGLGGSMKYKDASHQYTEKAMKKRISKLKTKLFLKKGFDILVTHAAAEGLGDGEDLCHRGFKCFRDLIDKHSPKYHFHGHQHLNYGINERIRKYNNTTIINACGYYVIDYKK
ncbi:Predicted phosphoesterase [Caloramator quimbayensis]|uniref:Predicted phosphoesterase n=1 Tax=Caloramator quimbayensis TaxID=1147123 RepID=A0A1T4XH07_9CLOT|nr:metallophosphoesterase [Caloramator quimbayensis]SKA88816.1 Predicted phosphoesterase [Caloramator quimbayensis]